MTLSTRLCSVPHKENDMSDPAQTLTPEQEAEAVLIDDVILPAFEEKCAANGRRFSSPDQVLRAYVDAQQIKDAAAKESGSVVDAAHADLCKAMGIETDEEKQAAAKAQEQAGAQAADDHIRGALATLAAAGQK